MALFAELREVEVLGLTWDCVDFERGIITIGKQVQLHQEKGCKAYELASTKNEKCCSMMAAPSIMALLKRHRAMQVQQKLLAGSAWKNRNDLVFTDALGSHLTKPTVYRKFKRVPPPSGGRMHGFGRKKRFK